MLVSVASILQQSQRREVEGMGLNCLWLIFAVVLGVYVFVFGFLRRVNDLWSFFKLGRKVYEALPPGDMGWPFAGLTLSFYRVFNAGGDPESFVNHLVSRNERIGMYKTHIYGKPTIIVIDPDICRRIYSDDERFSPSYPSSVKILGDGSGSASKIDHKHVYRLTAAPINGSEQLSHYVDYIEGIVVKSLEEWSSMKSEPIEFLSEMKSLTFRVILRVFMGSISETQIVELERLYTDLAAGVLSIFPYNFPGSTFHQALKARKKIVKILKSIIEDRRRRRMQNNEEIREEKCQMDVVMDAIDGNGKKLFNDNAIIDMLIGLLYAGHDTSAHAAMWALIQLTDHPQIFHKAKDEQELVIKERPPTQEGLTFKEIKEMKYLAKVINETLRKPTIVFANFREAKVDVNINGYIIPRGWRIAIWIRAVHKDPQIYPNPQEFDPSRWDSYTPKPGAFIPFGLGNRHCPGSELAKLESTILLHHFLLNYKLERVNPKCQLTHIPIPKPIDNCLCRIIRVDA